MANAANINQGNATEKLSESELLERARTALTLQEQLPWRRAQIPAILAEVARTEAIRRKEDAASGFWPDHPDK